MAHQPKKVIPIINITGNEQLTRVAVWLHHSFIVSEERKPDRELLEHGCCKLLHQFFICSINFSLCRFSNRTLGISSEVHADNLSEIIEA